MYLYVFNSIIINMSTTKQMCEMCDDEEEADLYCFETKRLECNSCHSEKEEN